MVVAVLVEVFVPLTEFSIHPEAPLSFITATEEDGPTATVINLDRVLVKSRAKAE